MLQSIWFESEPGEVRELRGNLYALSFINLEVTGSILENGPWTMMGFCLNLMRWATNRTIQELDFSKVSIWS